jgi:hypothetical protein
MRDIQFYVVKPGEVALVMHALDPISLRRPALRLLPALFCGLCLALCTSVWGGTKAPVNFSGTWKLDPAKSDVRQLAGMGGGGKDAKDVSLSMVIDHQGTTLTVTRTLTVDGETRQEHHTYKTDGSTTTHTGLRGESVVAKAAWQGDKLVLETTRTMSMLVKEVKVNSKGVWSLSADGKTLTIDGTLHSPRREQQVKAVFYKQ